MGFVRPFRFTTAIRRVRATSLACALGCVITAGIAHAAPADSEAQPSFSDTQSDPSVQGAERGVESQTKENLHVKGHRSLPPGYQDAPSMDVNHGPDPDHLDSVHRDAVTGSNLSHFGSAYQDSSPYGRGQLGDATGNGWVTPR